MVIQNLKLILLLSRTPRHFFLSSFSSSPSFDQTSKSQNLVSNVVSILTHQRSKSRWNYVHSLYPNGFDPNEFSLVTLHFRNNPHLALRFFRWTQRKSLCNHNLLSYSTIVHVLARGRLKSDAQDVIRTALRASMLEEGEKVDDRPVSKPLKVFESLVKTYKDCGSAPFVFDLLIKACLESRKIEPAIEIVRMLQSRGISPKVSTLNALISRVCQCRGVELGYEIYREVFGLDCENNKNGIKFARVSPNAYTFNALMTWFYQDGLVEKVKEIWHEMEELNCSTNTLSYNVLMAAFCEEGRIEEVEKLWDEMKNKEMEPDLVAYNTIIGGFCRNGNVRRAEEFLREMETQGLGSGPATYEHLIHGYCNVGDADSAVLVYKDMCRKEFRVGASTLDMLIRILCVNNRVHEALEFLRSSCATDSFALSPKRKSYEVLIKVLCDEGKMEEALKLQAKMVGKGHEPTSEIYGAFMDGYIKLGNVEMASILRKEMLETQMQREENQIAFNSCDA